MPNKSKARIISEAINPQIRQAIQLEQSKFRHARTGPTLSHALKVIKELHRVRGFRPEQNVEQRPTTGMDAEYDRYDPNPETRWDPEFRKQLETSRVGSKARRLLKKKDNTMVDPATGKPVDPETGEVIGNEEDEVPNDQEQEDPRQPQDKKANPNQNQQEPAQAQQAGDPQAQQDLDPDAGQSDDDEEEDDSELPTDQRKDPIWKGNQAAKRAPGQQDSSERIVGRYDISKDPLRGKPIGKPTDAYKIRQSIKKPNSHSKTGRHSPVQKYWG